MNQEQEKYLSTFELSVLIIILASIFFTALWYILSGPAPGDSAPYGSQQKSLGSWGNLTGTSKEQLRKLFGEPDLERKNVWTYKIGAKKSTTVYFRFDDNQEVSSITLNKTPLPQ